MHAALLLIFFIASSLLSLLFEFSILVTVLDNNQILNHQKVPRQDRLSVPTQSTRHAGVGGRGILDRRGRDIPELHL